MVKSQQVWKIEARKTSLFSVAGFQLIFFFINSPRKTITSRSPIHTRSSLHRNEHFLMYHESMEKSKKKYFSINYFEAWAVLERVESIALKQEKMCREDWYYRIISSRFSGTLFHFSSQPYVTRSRWILILSRWAGNKSILLKLECLWKTRLAGRLAFCGLSSRFRSVEAEEDGIGLWGKVKVCMQINR